jgi:DNA-binding NtrC family response regulator
MPGTRSVFIVDAEPRVRHALWRMLAGAGRSFRLFGDAAGALAALDARSPDLVVADLELPDQDGVALLAEMHERDPLVRKILLVGTETPAGARHALHDRIIDHVVAKPAGPLLAELVRQSLGEDADDAWLALAS